MVLPRQALYIAGQALPRPGSQSDRFKSVQLSPLQCFDNWKFSQYGKLLDRLHVLSGLQPIDRTRSVCCRRQEFFTLQGLFKNGGESRFREECLPEVVIFPSAAPV